LVQIGSLQKLVPVRGEVAVTLVVRND